MAISGTEVEVVGPGIRQNNPEKGSFVLNMVYNNSAWEVRKGFGQLGQWDSTLSRLTTTPGILERHEGYRNHLGSYLMTTNFGHRQIISVFEGVFFNCQGAGNNYFTDNTAGPATAVVPSVFDGKTLRIPMYVVSIYDITTGERWEEVLHRPLYDGGILSDMPNMHGHYESSSDDDWARPLVAKSPTQMSFIEFNDILFFGNADTGVQYYKPASFYGNRDKGLSYITGTAEARGYSENTLIQKVVLSKGPKRDAYFYLDQLPNIVCMTQVNGRLVYVTKDRLYFADPNYPTSIIGGNVLFVAAEKDITAVVEINGNLLIFTESETFLYQPSTGTFANAGRLTRIGVDIGCTSPNSFCRFGSAVAWVDKRGVWMNTGDLNIKTISQGITPFFDKFLTNPMGHYQLAQGVKNAAANKQPPIQYHYSSTNITMTYSSKLKCLLITFPTEKCTLCYNQNQEWSLWNYTSSAYFDSTTGLSSVGVWDFMKCDQILSDEDGIFAVGLDLDSAIENDVANKVNPTDGSYDTFEFDQPLKSYIITQYGRGGGTDRSIENEDYRYTRGQWRVTRNLAMFDSAIPKNPGGGVGPPQYDSNLSTEGISYMVQLGQPLKVKKGFILPGAEAAPAPEHEFENPGLLVPLRIKISSALKENARIIAQNQGLPIDNLYVEFNYDREHWNCVMDFQSYAAAPNKWATAHQVYMHPLENIGSGMGNTTALFAQTNFSQVANYNWVTPAWTGVLPTAATPSGLGTLVRVGFNIYDAMNLAGNQENSLDNWFPRHTLNAYRQRNPGAPVLPLLYDRWMTVCWIPFEQQDPEETTTSLGFSGFNSVAFLANSVANVPHAQVGGDFYILPHANYIWDTTKLGGSATNGDKKFDDNVAQGVDWAYASIPVGLGAGNNAKARGSYIELLSHGTAANPITNSWAAADMTQVRLLNQTITTDNTEWDAQVVDYGGILPGIKSGDVIDISTGEQNTIRKKVLDTNQVMQYDTFNNPSNTWGADNSTAGTILIDDEQFQTMATSASTKGEWFRWMYFGHILNKAEKLVLKSAKAVIRKVTGRRRRGKTK